MEIWKELNLNPNQVVNIYTDGSSKSNPGKGGWAAIIKQNGFSFEFYGNTANATNNQMELTAAIKGLKALQQPSRVIVFSDSEYLINAFSQNWIVKWQNNGWHTKTGTVKNKELWQELLEAACFHKEVAWQHIKGHNGNKDNERADFLAETIAENETTKFYTEPVKEITPPSEVELLKAELDRKNRFIDDLHLKLIRLNNGNLTKILDGWGKSLS